MVSSGQTHWDSHRKSDRALGSFQSNSSTLHQGATAMCTLWVFQFLTAVFKSHWPSVQLKDSSQCQIPGLGCPVCALNASLSREAIQAIMFSSSVHPLGNVSQSHHLFHSHLTSVILLHSLDCRRLSTSLQFVIGEKCSTCWFIVYVFVGVGELSTITLPSWSPPLKFL